MNTKESKQRCRACIARSGFTLLELLVVVAIIAILGAVTLGTVGKVRQTSNASKDLSNLRQLGAAVKNYLAEEGCFPGQPWATSLVARFVGDVRIFQSSFDGRASAQDLRSAPLSYDMNSWLYGMPEVQVASPFDCILLAPLMSDPAQRQFSSTVWTSGLPSPLSRHTNGTAETGGTHQNGEQISVIFADLHAASISMTDFHSEKPNNDMDSPIRDLRWNE